MKTQRAKSLPQGGMMTKTGLLRSLVCFLFAMWLFGPKADAQGCNPGNCTLGPDLVLTGSFNDGCPLTNTPSAPFGNAPGMTYVDCSNSALGTTNNHFSEADVASLGGWNSAAWTVAALPAGTGPNFLIEDGPLAGDNEIVWSKAVNVVSGTTYVYQAFFCNLLSPLSSKVFPQFQMQISDGCGAPAIVTGNQINKNNIWIPLCISYTARVTGPVMLQILMFGNGPNTMGNDGGIIGVTLQALPNDANFVYQQPACNNPFNFTAVNSDGSINNTGMSFWDFGDGQSLVGPVVPHLYSAPGQYIVTHTVCDACGTSSVSKIIMVESCCTCHVNDPLLQNNLVTDGSFTPSLCSGSLPFYSEYGNAGCYTAPAPGHFSETNTANMATWGRTYCSLSDHTPGTNTDFLLFDGMDNNTGFHTMWEQATSITPAEGSSYCFKASFNNPEYAYPAKPSVKLIIVACGVQYTVATLDFLPYNDECGWTTICGCWSSAANCSHIDSLKIVMGSNNCNFANDIAVDDIIFEPSESACNQGCNTQDEFNNSGYQLGLRPKGQDNTMSKDQQLMPMPNSVTGQSGVSDVHPIPVMRGQDLHLTYNASKAGNVLIQITSETGTVLITNNPMVQAGANDISILTNSLSPGSYILKSTGETGLQTYKIIVQ